VEIYSQLGNAKAATGRSQGRSIVMPNQEQPNNSMSLHEVKASSAIENVFTTDDTKVCNRQVFRFLIYFDIEFSGEGGTIFVSCTLKINALYF
jgi:hypothetical protein